MRLLPIGVAMMAMIFSAASQAPGQSDAYRQEVQEVAKGTRAKLRFFESPNMIWALACSEAEARPIIAGVEKGFDIWKEISGVERWEQMWGPKKALFVVLKNRLQYRNFLKYYAKRYADSPYLQWPFAETAGRVAYWPQPMPRPFAAMHLKPATIKNLTNTAVHVLGHLCMMRYKFNNYPIPPWLEEGFGCYLEARVLKRNNCYCFSGGYGDQAGRLDKLTDIEWKKWKQVVAGMVSSRSDKVMEQILPMRMNDLSAAEMGKAWSVIDFLVQKDNKKFVEWIAAWKRYWPRTYDLAYSPAKGEAQEKALKEVYGMSFADLDTQWRQWVSGGMR